MKSSVTLFFSLAKFLGGANDKDGPHTFFTPVAI